MMFRSEWRAIWRGRYSAAACTATAVLLLLLYLSAGRHATQHFYALQINPSPPLEGAAVNRFRPPSPLTVNESQDLINRDTPSDSLVEVRIPLKEEATPSSEHTRRTGNITTTRAKETLPGELGRMNTSSNVVQVALSSTTGPLLIFKADPIPSELYDFVDTLPLKDLTGRSRPNKSKDVLYIKTHKTGSETCATMFRRFGLLNDLTFAAPLGEAVTRNNLGWPWKFKKTFVYPSVTGKYNILLDHSVFTPEVMYDVMHEDVVTVTSMRESFSHLKSAFVYFKLPQWLGLTSKDPLGEYLLDLEKYDNKYKSLPGHSCIPHGVSAIRNVQALDLGFPLGFKDTQDKSTDVNFIQSFISNISHQIDLAIITEYFDESLIVLKHLLNWDFYDILYLKRNPTKYSTGAEVKYEPSLVQNAVNWNNVDTLLYRLLNRTLWHYTEQMGGDLFNRELLYFRHVLEDVTDVCGTNAAGRLSMTNNTVVLQVRGSEGSVDFNITNKDCYMMSSPLRKEIRQSLLQNMGRKYLDRPLPWSIPGC